jgi:hypothetical protein
MQCVSFPSLGTNGALYTLLPAGSEAWAGRNLGAAGVRRAEPGADVDRADAQGRDRWQGEDRPHETRGEPSIRCNGNVTLLPYLHERLAVLV